MMKRERADSIPAPGSSWGFVALLKGKGELAPIQLQVHSLYIRSDRDSNWRPFGSKALQTER